MAIMVFDHQPTGRPSPRRLARVVGLALGLAYQAGRRQLLAIVALQAVQAAGYALLLLLSRRVIDDVLGGGGAVAVIDSAALVAGLGALVAFSSSVATEQQLVLAELCERHARSRVLDVATSVDLAAFDDPFFHDRLQRAQTGLMRAPQIVFALFEIAVSIAGIAGAIAALLALEPLLVPLALIALLAVGGFRYFDRKAPRIAEEL
jgi:ABC-type multidrug transport system fused ATPase/permease subunit